MATITESPFANIYLKVMERLALMVPELRYIDQDLGQLENYTTRPAVSFPCGLIEVDEFDFSEVGNELRQIGEGVVMIRLGYPAFNPANNLAPAAVREKALEYYNIEQKIYQALHGWCADGFSRLLRRKSKREERDDTIKVRVMVFAASFDDDTAKPVYAKIPRPDAIISNNLLTEITTP